MARKANDVELFRGDHPSGVKLPLPSANPSVVAHVMGFSGDDSPYLSTSEDRSRAEIFGETVWETSYQTVKKHENRGVQIRSYDELLTLLKGRGFGDASWRSPAEVQRARFYVIKNVEHLLDFRRVPPDVDLSSLVSDLFSR